MNDTAQGTESGSATTPGGSTRRSLTSAFVYTAGMLLQRAIGLLMLPIYTRILPPDEYGVVGVLMAVYSGATIFFSLGFDTVIVRNFFQLSDQRERDEFVQTIWRFLTAWPLAAAVLITAIVLPFISNGDAATPTNLALTLVAAAVNCAATTLPLNVLRARQDLRGYIWVVAIATIATPLLTLLFVAGLDQGARGWFLAALLANVGVFTAAMVVLPWNRRSRFSSTAVRAALLFSIPLLPHVLSHWALQLADRLILAGLVSEAALGVYSLAANLAVPVMFAVMALNQGLAPTYARAGVKTPSGEPEVGREQLRRTVRLQLALVTAVTLVGAVVGPPLIILLTPPDYHAAAPLIPWLVLGFGFLGAYFIPMNGATLAVGRTRLVWVMTLVSAVTNLALLFIFVPSNGIEAAAIASAIGYFVLLCLVGFWAHARPNPVTYPWGTIVAVVGAGIVAYAAATVTEPSGAGAAFVVSLAWTAVFAGVLAFVFRSDIRALRARG